MGPESWSARLMNGSTEHTNPNPEGRKDIVDKMSTCNQMWEYQIGRSTRQELKGLAKAGLWKKIGSYFDMY